MVQRNFAHDTFTEPGTDGALVRDLATSADTGTLQSENVNNTAFTESQRWQRTVGAGVLANGSNTWNAQIDVSSFSGTVEGRFRLRRINSSGTPQSSSAYSATFSTTGVKTLSTTWNCGTWAAGDRIALSLEIRRSGGHGNVNQTNTLATTYIDAPEASSPATVTPAVISRVFATPAASPSAASNVSPSAAATLSDLPATTITTPVTVLPAVTARDILTPASTVDGPANTTPATAVTVGDAPAATITSPKTVLPAVTARDILTPASTVDGPANTTPATSVLAATLPASTPDGGGAQPASKVWKPTPRSFSKPGPWNADVGLVIPDFQKLWQDLVSLVPAWGDGFDVSTKTLSPTDSGVSFLPSRFGLSAFFDGGAANSIDLHSSINDAINGASQLTMMGLVRSVGDNQRRIISSSDGAAEADHYYMINQQGTAPRMRLKTSGTTTTLVGSTGEFPNNEWVMVFATYDGADMRLYTALESTNFNLVERASVGKTGTVTATGPSPVIGNVNATFSDSAGSWNGSIAVTAIWTRALSTSEMQVLTDQPFGIIAPNFDWTENPPPTYHPTPPTAIGSIPSPWNAEANLSDTRYKTLWNDLIACVPIWDSSVRPFDAATGRVGSDTTIPFTAGLGPLGPKLLQTSSDEYARWPADVHRQFTTGGPITLFWIGERIGASASGVPGVWGFMQDGSENLRLSSFTDEAMYLEWGNATSDHFIGLGINSFSQSLKIYVGFVEANRQYLRRYSLTGVLEAEATDTDNFTDVPQNGKLVLGKDVTDADLALDHHFAAAWNRELSDEEIQMLIADPYGMLRPNLDWTTPAVVGPPTVNPGVISVTETNPAPTVSAGATVTPAAADGVSALPAPSITVDATVTPSVIARDTVHPQASPSAGATLTPASITRSITVDAATVSAGSTTTPAVLARSFVIPQATGAGGATQTPATIARDFTLPSATVLAASTVEPSTIARSFVLPQSTIAIGKNVFPGVITVNLTTPQASPQAGATITPGVIARLIDLPQASPSAGSTVQPATAATTADTPAASIASGAMISVAVLNRDFLVPQASLAHGATMTPGTIARDFVIPQANPSTGSKAEPNVIARSFTVPQASLSAGAQVSVTTLARDLLLPQSSIAIAKTVNPGAVVATVTLDQASPQAGATITPATLARSFDLPAATAVTGGAVTPDVISQLFTVPGVAVNAPGSVSPVSLAVSVTLPAATPSAPGDVAPTTISRLFTIDPASVVAPTTVNPAAVDTSATVPVVVVVGPGNVAPDPIDLNVLLPGAIPVTIRIIFIEMEPGATSLYETVSGIDFFENIGGATS